MKRRELLWMLLPCLGLALFAVLLRNRPANYLVLGRDDGPFRMVVESVTREPVTAYEVSEGYDSKIKIVIGRRGDNPPAWWGKAGSGWGSNEGASIMFENKGNLRPVKLPPEFKWEPQVFFWRPNWNSEKKRYEARILTHLSNVPARQDRIVAQANLAIHDNTSRPISPPLYFSHTIRKAGEVIKAPVVSRDPGLKIESVEITPVPPVERSNGGGIGTALFGTPQARVRVHLLRARKEASSSAMGSIQLVDEKGATRHHGGSFSTDENEDPIGNKSDPRRERRLTLRFDCDLAHMPVSAGRVWLQTYYSIDKAWPLQLKIPVRDAQGKILYSAPASKPAPFVIESTKLRATNAQEKTDMGANTALEVLLKYNGPLPVGREVGQLPWRADFSQHLVDEKGKEYWKFAMPGSQISSSTSWTGSTAGSPPERRVKISYYLPLQQMPARLGRLKFHADISLPGTKFVPVDVVVREPKTAKPQVTPIPTNTS